EVCTQLPLSTSGGKNPKISPHPNPPPKPLSAGKIMPNTVLVGVIYLRVKEAEIWSFFKLCNTVYCEVKVITDRTGVSKGYGFCIFPRQCGCSKNNRHTNQLP
uniref:RRM domain-containing protein n=1 Tax=Serinus canaria TaxID=9135 RepID=A0A8C9MT17_SERCA